MNGFLVAYMRIPPMLATLGTLGAGLGVALLLQKGVNVATYALNPVATGHLIPGVSNLVRDRASWWSSSATSACTSPSSAGTRWRSARTRRLHDASASTCDGTCSRSTSSAGVASGFGGFLSLAYFSTTSVGGHTTDNLQAITAVALGGTSLFGGVATILGTVIGVWIPAVLQNGFIIVGVNPYWQMIASASCSWSPSGSTSCGDAARTGDDRADPAAAPAAVAAGRPAQRTGEA